MRKVTQEQFFAKIGPLDVHPRVVVATLKGRYHESIWEDRSRAPVGRSISDSWSVEKSEFFLVD